MAYGEHPDQVVDVWLPVGPSGPSPLVIFVHGGFWRAKYDRRHTRPLSVDLARRGYAVAAIEYRRTGQPGGGWPGTFDDVAAALDATPRLVAAATGGEQAGAAMTGGSEARPVIVAGHSAGGHLALWAAVRHRLPETAPWRLTGPPPYAGVLALAPVADLAAAHRQRLGSDAAGDLLGGGPDDVPDRYAATDPSALPPPAAPTTLVHGALDDRVPPDHSRDYTARKAARLVEIPDAEHFAVIDPLSAAWPTVLKALADLTSGSGVRSVPDPPT
ncbi:MAG: alpha/beta fold hydrolase [Micromonosporaceae bacterium]|nr:alpha/beta fold hydrolase [Micromonosporaceae bacterium]